MSTATADLRRCTRCQNLLEDEDLFCPDCGTEAPMHEHERTALARRPEWEVRAFSCRGCGASMSWDATKEALACPFCGAREIEQKASSEGITYPEKMIPFAIDRAGAEKRFREWLGKGFWRPGDLQKVASVEGVKPLFLPCWNFTGECDAHWAADVGAATKSGWQPASGSVREHMTGVLVPASNGLKETELRAVANYQFEGLIETTQQYLHGSVVEGFGVTRKGAKEKARPAFENAVAARVQQQMGGRKMRNVHTNVLISRMLSEPILLPLWIFAYRYKGEPYRFVMNGQTGKTTGKAPFSYKKLLAIIGIVVGVLGLIAGLILCLGVLGSVAGSM